MSANYSRFKFLTISMSGKFNLCQFILSFSLRKCKVLCIDYDDNFNRDQGISNKFQTSKKNSAKTWNDHCSLDLIDIDIRSSKLKNQRLSANHFVQCLGSIDPSGIWSWETKEFLCGLSPVWMPGEAEAYGMGRNILLRDACREIHKRSLEDLTDER